MKVPERYVDRTEAGKILAHFLEHLKHQPIVVLALPRGGVPVAEPVAEHLAAPLEVFIVRKLGVPHQEELAFGAIASGGVTVFNQDVLHHVQLNSEQVRQLIQREMEELHRRENYYRGNRPFPEVQNKIVVLVDDGLATGASMRAAVRAVSQMKPRSIVVAVPVGSAETCADLAKEADEIVCPSMPQHFQSVGRHYQNFNQTEDDEVCASLERAKNRTALRK